VPLAECAVVVAPYGGEEGKGTIGVLGPTRMNYPQALAAVAVVSQRYAGIDFNVPSKLMNFMAYGIPTVASVREDSEVARIIRESGGGWVTDCADTRHLADTLAEVLKAPGELRVRGQAALAFARSHFTPDSVAARFEAAFAEL
jgi:glycosyltransferase involved in cell wall biosynthesis